MQVEVVPLRCLPDHLPTVAGWIHEQWWSGTQTRVDAISNWLSGHLDEHGFPTTLLTLSGGVLTGSACLHESEARDRPSLTPYLGALYVAPGHRGRGLGAILVRSVEEEAKRLSHVALHLNAAEDMVPYYDALGWQVIERSYGPRNLTIMKRALSHNASVP